MKGIFKRWIGWMIGVLVASYGFSLWRGESIDWSSVIDFPRENHIGLPCG